MLDLDKLTDKIDQKARSYWPDFKLAAFALYDKEGVFLYRHPKFPTNNSSYSYLKRDEQFNGADTIILYEDYPTAIVNLQHYHDEESIYSMLMHELFHGFQYLKGEKRFPDEIQGMNYPLLSENVELRNQERHALYMAVTSADKKEKIKNVVNFIYLRENRRSYIDQYMDYELSIETVEGPAFYVELNAFKQYNKKRNEFGQILIDLEESTYHLRKSCCMSGLFISILLDELVEDWKDHFFDSNNYLYDILKENVEWEFSKIDRLQVSQENIDMIKSIKKKKTDLFHQFEHEEGYHLYLIGDIRLNGFDPMNVIVDGDRQLHKNFITIFMNNIEYHIQQPAIVHYDDKRRLNKLHIVLEEKPVVLSERIFIKGLGEVKGDFYKSGSHDYIEL